MNTQISQISIRQPKTIVFSGTFDIGEHIIPAQLKIVAEAKKHNTDIGIIVGDIGLIEKLGTYIKYGIEGVYPIYERRIKCATSGCVTSQLPEIQHISSVIDEREYTEMFEILQKEESPLIEFIRNISDLCLFTHTAYQREYELFSHILRERIVPVIIQQRLQRYNLSATTQIYSERVLRNYAQHRLRSRKKNQPKSWLRLFERTEKENGLLYLLLTEIEKETGRATCRGIMLALYEQLANAGYTNIVQLYPQKQFLAIKNAEELYKHLHEAFTEDPRWQLVFSDKFYK